MTKLTPSLFILSFILTLCLFIETPAFAGVTYSYTGNSLETSGGTAPTYDPIIMSLTFSGNGSSLLNWSVSQTQTGTITKSDTSGITYSGLIPQLDLTTNSFGQVSSWYVSVYSMYDLSSNNVYKESILSYNGQIAGLPIGSSFGVTARDDAVLMSPLPERRALNWGLTEFNPGTWSSSGKLANLNYQSQKALVPEPETYAMMLAGLGLIGFIAYRRKNNSSNMLMAA